MWIAQRVVRSWHYGRVGSFSRSEDSAIEVTYRIHWISRALSERKRERLAEKASRAPDLAVIRPLNSEWKCHRCGGTGDLLVMENPGPACLGCVGLWTRVLAGGRRAAVAAGEGKSTTCAVVASFSRSRRRYERQGLLVEPLALADVQRDLEARRRE
jgi:hypothetical protein